MTEILIQEQLSAIKLATDTALKSKEAARKFLCDAGIISKASNTNQKKAEKNKK